MTIALLGHVLCRTRVSVVDAPTYSVKLFDESCGKRKAYESSYHGACFGCVFSYAAVYLTALTAGKCFTGIGFVVFPNYLTVSLDSRGMSPVAIIVKNQIDRQANWRDWRTS